MGNPEDAKQIKEDLDNAFICKSEGKLKEYDGSTIDIKRKSNGLATIKFTQPVLIKKLEDEFDIPSGGSSKTPAVSVQVLVRGDGSNAGIGKEHKVYRSGTATCMGGRPEIADKSSR